MMTDRTKERAVAACWWRLKGRKRLSADPVREGGEGVFVCDEAVRVVAEWADGLGEHTSELHQFRPSQMAFECLLAGEDLGVDWADDGVVEEITGEARDALDAVYGRAWGRPPSWKECLALVEAARKKCPRRL